MAEEQTISAEDSSKKKIFLVNELIMKFDYLKRKASLTTLVKLTPLSFMSSDQLLFIAWNFQTGTENFQKDSLF